MGAASLPIIRHPVPSAEDMGMGQGHPRGYVRFPNSLGTKTDPYCLSRSPVIRGGTSRPVCPWLLLVWWPAATARPSRAGRRRAGV